MNRIRKVLHKGKSILVFDYTDFSHETEDEFIATIEEAAQYMIRQGPGQRTLTNVSAAFGSSRIVAKFKEVAQRTKPYRAKAAIVGIKGAKQIILNAVNMFSKSELKAFDTVEAALDWLVE